MLSGILGGTVGSFLELEGQVFRMAAEAASDVLVGLLEDADEHIFKMRDAERYRAIDTRTRELDTMFGTTLRFTRRYYRDLDTGEPVFLLDEALGLPGRARQSPGLRKLSVHLATDSSYRQTRDSLEQVLGVRVVSHESIRQCVLKTGAKREESLRCEPQIEPLQTAANGRKFIFIELDGIHCRMQRNRRARRRGIEVRLMYIHEGWEECLNNKRRFKPRKLRIRSWYPDDDCFDELVAWLYEHYNMDDNTIVVIGGDRAGWIRGARASFGDATVIYQVDRFHIARDVKRIFQTHSEGRRRLMDALDSDPTGASFMAALAEEMGNLPYKAKEEAQRMLNDLLQIPECVCDYRVRLREMGVDTQGLRPLGAVESRNSLFAARLKGFKKAWSPRGLMAMVDTLAAKFEGSLDHLLKALFDTLAPMPGEKLLKQKTLESVWNQIDARGPARSGNIPVKAAGVVRSGGLSSLFGSIASGREF